MQATLAAAQPAALARAAAMFAKHGFAPRRKGQRSMPNVLPLGGAVQQQLQANIVASCYVPLYNSFGRLVAAQYLVCAYNGQLLPCYRLRSAPGHYNNICQTFGYVPA